MGKSQKSTTNSTQNTVQTPTNPDWVTNDVQGLSGKINDLSKLDPYSLVSGPNQLQHQAAANATNLSGTHWNFDNAMGVTNGVAAAKTPQGSAASLLDGLQGYMSPYTNDVVNTTLKGFDQNAGLTEAQQRLAMAGSGAFGGSGAALTSALTTGQLAQQRAAAEAGLRDQAFNTGAGLSNQDAARRQSASFDNAQLTQQQQAQQLAAAAQMGNLSTQMGANDRANIATQAGLGGDLRNITQQQLGAPISLLSTQAGLTDALPYGLFHGQNTNQTGTSTTKSKESDPLGSLGSLAMLAAAPFTGGASLMGMGMAGLGLGGAAASGGAAMAAPWAASLSDERAKEDIQTVGHDAAGRRWVDFNYKGRPGRYRGVIAQEVARTDPHAVSMRPDGLLQVDYRQLGLGGV